MSFSVSAGTYVRETEAGSIIPLTLGTNAGFAGQFKWGPAGIAQLVSSETSLKATFGKPTDSTTAVDFMTAASYLAYSNALYISRIVSDDYMTSSYNAVAAEVGGSATAVLIKNDDVFNDTTIAAGTHVIARYAGAAGNGLKVIFVDSETQYEASAFDDYRGYFTGAPNSSQYVLDRSGSLDEMHVVVVDGTGYFSGTIGTVLETYSGLSKASDAKQDANNNLSNYYRDVINSLSAYIYIGDKDNAAAGLGTETGMTIAAAGAAFTASTSMVPVTYTLASGADGTISLAEKQTAYDVFANPNEVDVSLLIGGTADDILSAYIIQNIAEVRKDCVAFISPPQALVVNQTNLDSVAQDVADYRKNDLVLSSSYGFLDSGWKYMYDRYNDINRWIPLNGDIAGLCARTDGDRDPWWSPAGLNRGQIKNLIKLAWNPNEAQRDVLYPAGVNPVVSLSGRGTVLFGDKTLLAKPSSFDRINVRRLFIVLEKLIANASQYQLFEFNDEFTQSSFIAMVEPVLRDVQGRRGITDFRVVCDASNNTPQVVDSNQFKASIKVKPARSINFIELTFTSVGTNVSFDEVGA